MRPYSRVRLSVAPRFSDEEPAIALPTAKYLNRQAFNQDNLAAFLHNAIPSPKKGRTPCVGTTRP